MTDETSKDVLRRYVSALVEHAESALWPERRQALESFRRGIAKSDPADLENALLGLGVEVGADDDMAETVYRVVLTVYLAQVDDGPINNPDQAALFSASLDEEHIARARAWYDEHPEHGAGG